MYNFELIYIYTVSRGQKFTYSMRDLQNVNYHTTCYFLYSAQTFTDALKE